MWSRTRRRSVRDWQVQRAPDAILNMAPQRHVGDATWRALARNAVSRREGRHAVEAQWDITKCFENVSHTLLARQALSLGYPPAILRMSIASYNWGRLLIWDAGIIKGFWYATRGVVAGSGFATYELSAYTIIELRIARASAPG